MASFGPDTFTVASDQNLTTYNGDYIEATGGTHTVNAANDNVRPPTPGDQVAYYDGTGTLTDAMASAAIYLLNGSQSGFLAARCTGTGGSFNGYVAYIIGGATTQYLYRVDDNAWTEVGTYALTSTAATAQTWDFEVTGSGATVTCRLRVAAGSWASVADTDANRKLSGYFGFGGNATVAGNVTIDDFEIEDLVAPPPATYPAFTEDILRVFVA